MTGCCDSYGMVWNISDEYIELMKEGIKVYKEIRNEIKMVYQNKTVDSI